MKVLPCGYHAFKEKEPISSDAGIEKKKEGEKKMCYPMLRDRTLAIRPPPTW